MPPLRKPRLFRRGIVDKYYLIAFIALVLYVMMVTSIAWTIEAHILSRQKRASPVSVPSSSSTEATAISYKPVNEMELVRAGLDFAQRGVEAAWRTFTFAKLPLAQLAAIDLAFLVKLKDLSTPSLIVDKIDALLLHKENTAGADEHIGILLSLASLFEKQKYPAEASACRKRMNDQLRVHARGASLGELKLVSEKWPAEAASSVGVALHLISGANLQNMKAEMNTVDSLLQNEKTQALTRAYKQHEHWALPENLLWSVAYPSARVGGPSTLSASTLKYLELLLGLWLVGDKKDVALRTAYERTVEGLMAHLVGTATHATNYTFLYRWGQQGKVPLLDPEGCAAAGVLARGVKYRVHRYAGRDAAFHYEDEDILATAEAIAASCYQLYLRGGKSIDGSQTAYVEQDFAVLLQASERRCGMRKTLLRNCYELYEVTQDPMYAAWALRLMQLPNAHCQPTSAHELLLPSTYGDYVEELRYFTLLFQSMRCKLYKNSLKSDRTCKMWPGVLVTKRGYLLHLDHVVS